VPCTLTTVAYKLGSRKLRPWLPYPVLRRLRTLLDPGWTVLEFGSGGSTIWLARRVRRVVSIEHDPPWFDWVQQEVSRRRLDNVDQRLCTDSDTYVAVSGYPPGVFDLTIVDGHWRDRAAQKALVATRAGGWIYLDNSDVTEPGHRAAVRTLLAGAAAAERLVGLASTQIAANQGLLVRTR
jgi:predicted O-methyltransferase YrrM